MSSDLNVQKLAKKNPFIIKVGHSERGFLFLLLDGFVCFRCFVGCVCVFLNLGTRETGGLGIKDRCLVRARFRNYLKHAFDPEVL